MHRVHNSINGLPIIQYEPMDQKALMKGTLRDTSPEKWMSAKDFTRINVGKYDILGKSSKRLLVSGKEEPYMEKKSQFLFKNKEDERTKGFKSVNNKDPMHKVQLLKSNSIRAMRAEEAIKSMQKTQTSSYGLM